MSDTLQGPPAQGPPAQGPPPTDRMPAPEPPPTPWVILTRLVGGLIALSLVGITTMALVSYFFQRTVEETLEITRPVSSLVGDVDRGTTTIRTDEHRSTVRIDSVRRFAFNYGRVATAVEDEELQVGAHCDPAMDQVFATCSVDLDISLPPGVAVRISAAAGTILLDRPDDRLDLTTASGSVRVTGAASKVVDVSTGAGSVVLEFAEPPDDVVVRTAAGSVQVIVPDDGTRYHVTGSTSVGSRTVRVPLDDSSGHRIDVSSSVGKVQVTTR